MKLTSINGLWIVEDRGVNKRFDTSHDAWTYIFLMKGIRPKAPQVPRSIYPVRSLNPMPRVRKKIVVLRDF